MRPERESSTDQEGAPGPSKEDAETQKEGAPKDGGEGSSGEEEESPTEDYLKNVGDSVAQMLDPLGKLNFFSAL